MAERERGKDRAPPGQHTSSTSGVWSTLFGKRTTPVPPTTSRAHATSDNRGRGAEREVVIDTGRRGSIVDEVFSPKSGDEGRRGLSPARGVFNLEVAMDLLQNGEEKVLNEVIRATAIWLETGEDTKAVIKPEDLDTLFTKVTNFADPKTETTLRIAALQLLAALIAQYPPPKSILDVQPAMKAARTKRSLYLLIRKGDNVDLGLIHSQIGALRALTKDGNELDEFDGLVGWLMRMIKQVGEEWRAWCSRRDDKPVLSEPRLSKDPYASPPAITPSDLVQAIIALLNQIILHNTPLFSNEDISRILLPILDLFYTGISALPPDPTLRGASDLHRFHDSPLASAMNSPIASLTGLGLDHPRRSSIRTSQNASSHNTPTPSTTRQPPRRSTTTSPESALSPRLHSPNYFPQPGIPKWAGPLPSLLALLEMLWKKTYLSEDLLDRIMVFLCFCLGQDNNLNDETEDEVLGSVDIMLSPSGGRRGELSLRNILENRVSGKTEDKDFKRLASGRFVARGAVVAAGSLLRQSGRSNDAANASSLPTLVPYIRAAQSTSRFIGDNIQAQRSEWLPVDTEILTLLQDHLSYLSGLSGAGAGGSGDAWTEGDAACELLRGLIPVVRGLQNGNEPIARKLFSNDPHALSPFALLFSSIVRQLPTSITHLHTSTSISPQFHHPKYVDLLLELAPHIDESLASIVIDFYQREGLCLPFTLSWIRNIWKLLNAFHLASSGLPIARNRVAKLLLSTVYSYAEEFAEYRNELIREVIVPFLERTLLDGSDEDITIEALSVLVRAGVQETLDLDETSRINKPQTTEMDEEESSAVPTTGLQQHVSGGNFDAIRGLIIRLAVQTACASEVPVSVPGPAANAFSLAASQSTSFVEGLTVERKASRGKSRETSGSGTGTLRGLMGTFSPPARSTKELPSMSALTSPGSEDSPQLPPIQSVGDVPAQIPPVHSDCRSLHAVTSLIEMFTRLAFSPPQSLTPSRLARRTPITMRSVLIYRNLLSLLYPMTDDTLHDPSANPAVPVKIPARCPRARIVILQFLIRIRADNKHRIYIRSDLDTAVTPFATTLKRTAETENAMREEAEEARRRSALRNTPRGDVPEERGRAVRKKDDVPRSSSRSRPPPVVKGADPSYHPLWRIPDDLGFTPPGDEGPSEILTTYDPKHPAVKDITLPGQRVHGIWLPVSEYIRALNGILRGHDWELVSYLLCFLPSQLSNKLFFHGARATEEVKALLNVLCDGVLGRGSWERRFNVPTFIKKNDINAAAYQSLGVLISYRGVFDRKDCENLVNAFMAGLQGLQSVAKPCIQCLTICIYELDAQLERPLGEIIKSMISISLTPGLAIHILEFMITLGQQGRLFRNFTEEQYRLVFRAATNYIGEHNARSDAVDLADALKREQYTLSQHVVGLAYYSIYIWFMVLKLRDRPGNVSEITRELLKGRSQRVALDEMAEVCFDWLARYTYGNADPKPATSFLSEMVMVARAGEEPKSQSWLLGGAIITITSHPRSGWATITTTRPTGSTAVVCKLENVPMLELGEADMDSVSLSAFLMANRRPEENAGGGDLPEAREVVEATSGEVKPAASKFDEASQHGYIWSGATPSQRRKDVVVEPSYLGLSLLSAYPTSNVDAPRGRLIPTDDRYQRTLRGITNTPVIDTLKIAVLYVGPGQTTESQVLGNVDGSPLYLDFLSGLGRLIRLKGQVDVFVGGLNRDNDSDGEYAYAWWDDLSQTIFHTPTMMPNNPAYPNCENKKRLVGNDYVKIVYNDSGREFAFDTIKTAWNFINIVISPDPTGPGEDNLPKGAATNGWRIPGFEVSKRPEEGWKDYDRDDWFKVTTQRAPGVPEFGPIGTHKLVSRRSLPILVRDMAHLATDLAARYEKVRDATDAVGAEYITSWRYRLRQMAQLRSRLPVFEVPPEDDIEGREQVVRDFTRSFSYQPTNTEKE